MDENQLQDRRRANLARWLEDKGGASRALEGRQGIPPSYASFLSQVINGYSFGSRAARTCEERLGMAPLSLDSADTAVQLAEDCPTSTGTPIDLIANPAYPAIQRVAFRLQAGVTGFAVEALDGEDDPIVFRADWFASRGLVPGKLFAVRVSGESMQPGLWPGDTVVVNTADVTPRDGEVFAVNYEGELVIKRLVRDAGQWWLCSDNPDSARYPRKLCNDTTLLIGRIVHKQSERV